MSGYSRRGGYSRRMSYADGGSYDGGGSYADMSYADDGRSYAPNDGSGSYVRPDGSYRDGGSYARGRRGNVRRDSMGRYSRAEDEMTEGLMRLMDKAPDEQTRSEIRKLMERM